MATSSKKKRLADVEISLTPKEWAIRLADQMRTHPSEADFFRAIAKGTLEGSPIFRPFLALGEQVDKRHPGKKPQDIHAKRKLSQALRTEYHGLKGLIVSVNETVKTKGEVTGLRAALKLARLETMVLQDAFGRTARKAAEWIEEYKTADDDDEENRQIMLSELEAYADVDYGEKWSDSVPLPGGIRFRCSSVIEDWVTEVAALACEVFAHRAAVRVVQDKHFDGHEILFKDVEAGLDETIKTLEDAIATFNAYLKTRAELFRAEWEVDEEENDGVATAIPGEREGRLTIDIDSIHLSVKKHMGKHVATQWIKNAKDTAKASILEETDEHGTFVWDHFREQVGVKA